MKAWWNQYTWFRSTGLELNYDEHSVCVPYQLSQLPRLRDSIHILPRTAFFYPHPTRTEKLFVDEDVSGFQDSYCVHLWESISGPTLFNLTPESIRDGKSAYCQLARQFLTDEIQVTCPATPPSR